jgi:hypothetical protein
MPKPNYEVANANRPGRRSGVRRLLYRTPNTQGASGPNGIHARDWAAIKDQLRRTVHRAPEVVIIVDGGGRQDAHGNRSALRDIEGVRKYMLYISRNGKLPALNEQNEEIKDRDGICEAHAAWNLDLQRQTGWVTNNRKGRGGRIDQLHQTFGVIFSMPQGTDPHILFASVQAFARKHFENRQYLMVLHTPETDPAPTSKRADHPHVHLILRAEDDDGQRIYIRKQDLRIWREDFAAQLRARGIEANATSRAERGVPLKAVRGAEHHITERWKQGKGDPSDAWTRRFRQAAQDLQEGRTEPKPWELAMAARRRDVLRDLSENINRLRSEGDHLLADQVEKFMHNMPVVDSERRQMQRALIKQVKERLDKHEHERGATERDREE